MARFIFGPPICQCCFALLRWRFASNSNHLTKEKRFICVYLLWREDFFFLLLTWPFFARFAPFLANFLPMLAFPVSKMYCRATVGKLQGSSRGCHSERKNPESFRIACFRPNSPGTEPFLFGSETVSLTPGLPTRVVALQTPFP